MIQRYCAFHHMVLRTPNSEFWFHLYLAHVIEQPIFRIPNILFVYFFIDFFVKHIFFEARLERVIDGAADCWSYFWSSKK